MIRWNALVGFLIALAVSAGLLYLSYRLIAWGVERDTYRDLWSAGIWGLFVGIPGLLVLVGAIGSMIVAITGRELPTSPETGTARNVGTRSDFGSGRNAGVEFDGGDWVD
jgi:hypothetical protein